MGAPIITLATYQLDRSRLDADFAKIQENLKSTESTAKKTGDNIATSVKKGTAAIGDMSTETGRLERTVQRIGERLVAALAIDTVLNFAKSSVEAFFQAADASNKLLFALNGNASAYQELSKQAEQIRGKLGFEETEIKKVQAYLAAMGLTEQQIKKVVAVSLDLSNVTGEDLQTTATKLAATYEGVRGRLSKYSDEVRTMTISQLEAGDAVEVLGNKFRGMAEQIDKSELEIRKAGANLKSIWENVGGDLSKSLNSIVDGFKLLFNPLAKMDEEFGIVNETIDEGNAKSVKPLIENLKNLNLQLQDAKETLSEAEIGTNAFNKAQQNVLELTAKIAHAQGEKTEAEKKAAEELKKRLELQKQANADLVTLSGETQKALAAGEEEGLQKRQDLLEADRIATQRKNEERLAKDLEAYKGNSIKQAEIRKAFNENSLALDNALAEAQDKLRREQAAKDLQAEESRQKQNKENLQADFKESQELLTRLGLEKETKLDEQRASGRISEKQYQKEIRETELQSLQDRLADAKVRGEDTISLEKQIAQKQIEIANAKAERLKEIEQSIANVITTVADGILSIQAKNRDIAESDAQKKYDNDSKALDEQLKKKQISQKKYDTEKAALDKKFQEEENQRKRARDIADKNAAVYKVLIQAAEAEALDFLTADYVKAAADAAVAAAQIAIIEATPLPKYAKGTLSVKGGREGTDSVPALLMPGEAVVPTKEARRYNKAISAMLNGGFDEFVLKSYLPWLLEAENNAKGGMSEKMIQSLQFNDRRLIRAIKDSKPDGTVELGERTISKLASQLSGGNQRTSNLYKRYGK